MYQLPCTIRQCVYPSLKIGFVLRLKKNQYCKHKQNKQTKTKSTQTHLVTVQVGHQGVLSDVISLNQPSRILNYYSL